jgi:hypothetical protein
MSTGRGRRGRTRRHLRSIRTDRAIHWIRDVVFAEDHSPIRTSNGPAVMATLCTLALSRHRLAGATNIAAACRHVGRHPDRALPLLTMTISSLIALHIYSAS